MKLDDKFFRRLTMSLTILGLGFFFVLAVHFWIQIPLTSVRLWLGVAIATISVAAYYSTEKITHKLAVTLASGLAIAVYITQVLQWALFPNILYGMLGVGALYLLCLTFTS